MLKIQIKSLSFFLVSNVVPPGFIVIELERGHVLVGKSVLPAGKHVGSAQIRVAFDDLRIWRIQVRDYLFGAGFSPIHIALEREKIGFTGVPIDAETAPRHSPIVRRVATGIKKA